MAEKNPISYNTGGNTSSVGLQLVDYVYVRKALAENKKRMIFSQMADVKSMPKNSGKTIKQYKHIPILDDRNINDQGIDATGASTTMSVTIDIADNSKYTKRHAVGTGASDSAALTAAKSSATDYFKMIGVFKTDYATTKTALEGAGWTITEHTAVPVAGNLYGSSKDIGTITGRYPALSEQGGRKNRVGWTRVTLEGTINKFGFFEEYTEDSMNFDTEADLYQQITSSALTAAQEVYEDMLQVDLLNGAGITLYGGTATSAATLDSTCTLTYPMLVKLEKVLDDTGCPKDTTIIAGSRMIDTKTVGSSRYIYIGSELKPTLLAMKDYHNNPAFIPVHQYASAGNIAEGEIGSIAGFRFIEAPKMLYWEGAGATLLGSDTVPSYQTNGKYDVFPALVVGSGSFTTIGFQSGGNGTSKFTIISKKPGIETASTSDPFGSKGFYAIKWWYGSMILRPEHIAVVKVTAPAMIA